MCQSNNVFFYLICTTIFDKGEWEQSQEWEKECECESGPDVGK